jgi:hypothetical protein
LKQVPSKRLVIVIALTLLSSALTAMGCKPASPSSAGATATPGQLVAFQQEILYDRRGTDINAILLNRAVVVINPGAVPVKTIISRKLLSQEVQNLDLESVFPIMADILPPGVVLPPVEQIRVLPAPGQELATSRGMTLRWEEVVINPGQAVVAHYSGHFQDPAELVQGDTVVLPLARLQAAGGLEGDNLNLEYKVRNTCMVPLEGVKLSVFLPVKVAPKSTTEPVTLYDIVQMKPFPNPIDFIDKTTMMDGRFTMAEGDLIQFGVPRLESQKEQTFVLRATIRRTGNHGEVVPYLILTYHATTEPAERFEVQITSPSGTTVIFTPTLQNCNLGWPDVVRISF